MTTDDTAIELETNALHPETILQIIQARAGLHPDNIALIAPGRKPLTYVRLYEHVIDVGQRLRSWGVNRNDQIAIVLNNGPEMASAFLATASTVTCAPLNPSYRESEFEFFLSDLKPKGLLLGRDQPSPARNVAAELGIQIIELTQNNDEGAGLFSIPNNSTTTSSHNVAKGDDIALVLHTSGTTSRPKIVPLTQKNLCVSAHNIATALKLSEKDRCLNVMPLFHIHGLIGAVLSTIAAGGSVVCTPGFLAPSFFDWIDEFSPSWYTAVPTMHQSVMARIKSNPSVTINSNLRFIRSSSAALPPQVMEELEAAFSAPVIESYGMTEACHQMASNPLPPAARKPGTVGIPAGPEITILDDNGVRCPSPEIGEIAIKGENVTSGYQNNPSANQDSFVDGWLKTGDQGYFDEDGYLFITGRLKEIINRGGEKISPREVDEVLLDHPAIAEAVTFAVPNERLGEEIAAAVVLKDGQTATEKEIRRFASEKLTDFKVPGQVVILDQIPKGPTGKVQRIGLAETLGLSGENDVDQAGDAQTPPGTATEIKLTDIWKQVLKLDSLGTNEKFLFVGGDSLLAIRLIVRIGDAFSVRLSILDFFDAPTVAQQAEIIDQLIEHDQK